MKKPFFTIIVVSYNAGDKLIGTIKSIVDQKFTDYRVLIKDGMSTDGSIDKLKSTFAVEDAKEGKEGKEQKISLLESCDNGIYHAMNIATAFLAEESEIIRQEPSFVFFLNCGDYFRNKNVLGDVHDFIVKWSLKEGTTLPSIYYGDIFDCSANSKVASNPKIDDYACYRNVPSHQACFYDERLIYGNPFELKYRVRADYEHFLRCFYNEKAQTVYMPIVIADYEGGGFSDKNRKISEEERREIITMYLEPSKVRKFDFLRIITLAHLRTAISSSKITAGPYNSLKNMIYAIRGKKKS